jgi:VanZ family protein
MSKLSSQAPNRKIFLAGTLCYAALIVYGSLYPLSGWRVPAASIFSFLTDPIPEHLYRSDLLTNVLAYIPLGALIVWTIKLKRNAPAVIVTATMGGLLSLTVESIQMFLPSRTSSNVDLLTNVAGTVLGAALGCVLRPRSAFMLRLNAVRNRWFSGDRRADVALAAVLLWASSQLSPFVPSMDVSSIRQGLSPLWYALNDPSIISGLKTAEYALDIVGLALLTTVIAQWHRRVLGYFLAFAGIVLCLEPFIVKRQFSPEEILGLILAGIAAALMPRGKELRALLAILCIVAGFIIDEVTPKGGATHAFQWIPFAGHLDNRVAAFGSILEGLWPFVAISALMMLGFEFKRKVMIYGGGALLLIVFALEWLQQQVPGRYADITTVILAAIGWTAPWLWVRFG